MYSNKLFNIEEGIVYIIKIHILKDQMHVIKKLKLKCMLYKWIFINSKLQTIIREKAIINANRSKKTKI